MGEMINVYKILVRKAEGKIGYHLGDSGADGMKILK
jgi:hypothetical protein